MSSVNLKNARSHIVFIIGLLAAVTYILWVEGYIGKGEQIKAELPKEGWHVDLKPIATADQASQICEAANAVQVECTVVPPISGEAP